HVCIRLANEYPSERIYRKTDRFGGKRSRSSEIGFRTHSSTRPMIISDLAQSIFEGAVLLHDRETVLQCKKFQTINGKPQAPSGEYDDRVLALALAVHGIQSYPQIRERVQSPYKRTDGKIERLRFPDSRRGPLP